MIYMFYFNILVNKELFDSYHWKLAEIKLYYNQVVVSKFRFTSKILYRMPFKLPHPLNSLNNLYLLFPSQNSLRLFNDHSKLIT